MTILQTEIVQCAKQWCRSHGKKAVVFIATDDQRVKEWVCIEFEKSKLRERLKFMCTCEVLA